MSVVSAVDDRDNDGFLSDGDLVKGRDGDKSSHKIFRENLASLSALADFLEKATGLKRICFTAEDGYMLYSGRESAEVERILDIKKRSSIPVSQFHEPENLVRLKNKIQIRSSVCSQKRAPEREKCSRDWEQKKNELVTSAEVYNQAVATWSDHKSRIAAEFSDDQVHEASVKDGLAVLQQLRRDQKKFQELYRGYLGEMDLEAAGDTKYFW